MSNANDQRMLPAAPSASIDPTRRKLFVAGAGVAAAAGASFAATAADTKSGAPAGRSAKRSKVQKKVVNFGVAWEGLFGYVQGIKVKDTIYLSGQLSHDKQGNLIAPAALTKEGRPADFSTMEEQIRQTYKNAITLLAEFGATLDDVVEETLFVLDVPSAFVAGGKVRKEMYGVAQPQCASNIIGVSALAFPPQIVEITFRAVVSE